MSCARLYEVMGMDRLIAYLTDRVPSIEIEGIVGGGFRVYGGGRQADGDTLYNTLRALARALESV